MKENITYKILDILSTMQEACQSLYNSARDRNHGYFSQLYQDMRVGLSQLIQIGNTNAADDESSEKLSACCRSCLASLLQIYSYYSNEGELCLHKIEFELLPLLQETYLQFYIYGYLTAHPEKFAEYNQREIKALCCNYYIDEAIQCGAYKYDLSIIVLAYNKLEYTTQCVESLLKNLPQNMRYELIFVNHGSNDGTKEFFSSKSPNKQLDIAVNGGGLGALNRIVEGEFTLAISNDVIIGPNAIENLVACIRSDSQIAWVVPTTPNVSNFQTVPSNYHTISEFYEFTKKNNQCDPMRWEQRTRLCNPIAIIRNSVFYSSSGLCLNGRFHSLKTFSFPDDRISLFLRRHGYKMMLAKDAYCHHFGSVTLKSEIQMQGERDYYSAGRKEFYKAYGVDPWGTGFCFAAPFLKRVVGVETGHVDVLGINCGLGANSLKVKEQLKEYCHNLDVKLYNVTDMSQYIDDLRGISDEVCLVSDLTQAKEFFAQRCYQYIVWEEPFLLRSNSEILVEIIGHSLHPGGMVFAKRNQQLDYWIKKSLNWSELGDQWIVYRSRSD